MKQSTEPFLLHTIDPLYKLFLDSYKATGYGEIVGVDEKALIYLLPDEVLSKTLNEGQKLELLKTGTCLFGKNDRLYFQPGEGKLHIMYRNLNKYNNRGTEILSSEVKYSNPNSNILYLNTYAQGYQDYIKDRIINMASNNYLAAEQKMLQHFPSVVCANNLSYDAKSRLLKSGLLKMNDERILLLNLNVGKLFISKDFIKDKPGKIANRFRPVKRNEVRFHWELESTINLASKFQNDKKMTRQSGNNLSL